MRHGISTTIVEIDPVVYDAATRFFGLPASGPGQVFLEDARGWVRNRSASAIASSTTESGTTATTLYDIVVHDCFSGGGIPAHLYTQQFWQDLKNIVTPDAVIAVVSIYPLLAMTSGLIARSSPRTLPGSWSLTPRRP